MSRSPSSTPLQAQRSGVSTVFQEFNLLPERSVAENVFLGREPLRRGLVDAQRMASETAALLDDLGVSGIRPGTRVGSLSVAQQQVVEIVKALSARKASVSWRTCFAPGTPSFRTALLPSGSSAGQPSGG